MGVLPQHSLGAQQQAQLQQQHQHQQHEQQQQQQYRPTTGDEFAGAGTFLTGGEGRVSASDLGADDRGFLSSGGGMDGARPLSFRDGGPAAGGAEQVRDADEEEGDDALDGLTAADAVRQLRGVLSAQQPTLE